MERLFVTRHGTFELTHVELVGEFLHHAGWCCLSLIDNGCKTIIFICRSMSFFDETCHERGFTDTAIPINRDNIVGGICWLEDAFSQELQFVRSPYKNLLRVCYWLYTFGIVLFNE